MLHFDSFSNHLEIQAIGQGNNMCDDFPIPTVGGKFVDKTAVDLERTDRKELQVAQRRMPGAEIINMDLYSHVSEPVHSLYGRINVLHDHTLGNFQYQGVRINARLCEKSGEYANQVL